MLTPEIILGPPGTGKTTTLIRMVEEALKNGIRPEKIGYFSFTRRAAYEARERATENLGIDSKDLPYFRTLHSFAFRQIGATKSTILDRMGLRDFGDSIGMPVSGVWNAEDSIFSGGMRDADRYLFLENRARVKCIPYKDEFYHYGEYLDRHMFEWICSSLNTFKKKQGLLDYTDMIDQFIDRGVCPEFDVVFIDEAQDNTRQQWKMVEKIAAHSRRVVVAGDDDQAIFEWSGADVRYFINLSGHERVLGRSYRVPREPMQIASRILHRIQSRREKEWEPRDNDGSVQYVSNLDSVDMSSGSWLVLARNNWFLKKIEEQCRGEGFMYSVRHRRSIDPEMLQAVIDWEKFRSGHIKIDSDIENRLKNYLKRNRYFYLGMKGQKNDLPIWHEALEKIPVKDRVYLIAALRRGEKPTKTPRITISTIHGAKGGEAQNVVLLTTIAAKSYDETVANPDSECRVFYVGATRAKENLYIVQPESPYYFSL